MNTISYEDACECFGFKENEVFSLDELCTLFYQWKRENPDESIEANNIMQQAYRILLEPKIVDAWKTILPSSMNIYEALQIFGENCTDMTSIRPIGFYSSKYGINQKFETYTTFRCSTLETAIQLDHAYRIIWAYPFPYQEKLPSVSMKPPFSPLFQKILDTKMANGWNVIPYAESSIASVQAKALFNLPGSTLYVTPEDITVTFRNLQATCSSVEVAQQLDMAYSWLFEKYTISREYFAGPIDPPYAQVLAKKLDQVVTSPVIEQEATAPVEAIFEPARAKVSQKDIINVHALPKAPISLEMSVDEARMVLQFGKNETVTLEVLYTRYKDTSAANDSKAVQEEIDTAYQVLIAQLKNQSKEMTEEKARKFYDYGSDEILYKDELLDRYTNIIADRELAHLHDEAKKAYLVLEKIAA